MTGNQSCEDLQARVDELQTELERYKEKELDLLELEEKYRLYFEKSTDVMFSISSEGEILSVSPSVEKMLGYKPEELISGKIYEMGILQPASLNKALILLGHISEGGQVDPEQYEFIAKDGTRRVGTVTSVSLVRHGKMSSIVAVGRDVTESVKATECISEINEQINTLLQAIPDIVYFKDAAGRNISVNKSFELFAGLPKDKIEGRTDGEIFLPEFASRQKMTDEPVIRGGKTVHLEEYFQKPDGSRIFFDTIKAPICDKTGNVIGLVGVSRDITDRKQAEVYLRQSEERYRSFVESTFFGFAIFEIPTAQFILINEVACRMFGYTMSETQEILVWDVIHPDEHENLKNRVASKISSRIPYSSPETYTGVRKDGSFIRVQVNAAPVPYMGRTAMQVVFIDITETEHLEKQFQQAQRMEAVGTLAGGIAHDFNNLLMGVLGNISLILMGKKGGEEDYERLKNIERYVLRGSELTKRLLGFARGGKYEVRVTDLGEYVERSLDMFARTKKEIRTHYKVEEGLWTVEVDHGQMEQVLLNLFVNAWQAMPDGGELFVECRNEVLTDGIVGPHALKSGRFVQLDVKDTGIGMDEATRVRIFDPFFTTKERGIGTGLGLASVYGILKNHGGFVTVESETGAGSSFHIYLPASTREPEYEREVENEVKEGAETVLLVDDEEMVVDVGTDMLRSMGYTVLSAHSGEDALALYQKHMSEIGLVILDMIMPGMGGLKTYERLKELDPGVKVLLSSGYSRDGQAEEILTRGCNGFIQKPFSLQDLSLKIREIIDLSCIASGVPE